ncbi:MAG TPA: hypothetical protein VN932_09880 [Rhizomicrobium sp.]|nr:hypothetical protein [Rhizomicrobium sp.]
MRIRQTAAAIGVVAFLAGPALAQEDNQAPASAPDASSQIGDATVGDQSTAPVLDDINAASEAFPDSTKIPEPNPNSAMPSTPDDPH